jgi:hypothetical protein
MNDPRLARAINRMSHALDRIEASITALPPTPDDMMVPRSELDAITARHDRLRATMTQAIGRIDALLGEGQE